MEDRSAVGRVGVVVAVAVCPAAAAPLAAGGLPDVGVVVGVEPPPFDAL